MWNEVQNELRNKVRDEQRNKLRNKVQNKAQNKLRNTIGKQRTSPTGIHSDTEVDAPVPAAPPDKLRAPRAHLL